MEDVLEVYAEPYDPTRPKVNFDETTKQLMQETRQPRPAQPGRPQRYAIRPIVEPSLRTRLALAASSQRPVTRTQRAMGELLRELVQQHLGGRAEVQKRAQSYQ